MRIIGSQAYTDKMRSIFGASIIRHWPLGDAVGATSVKDISGNAGHGAPTSVTFGVAGPKGHTCASFNGTTSRINIYSVAFNTIFDHDEGTAMCWFRMVSAGVWTDGGLRVGLELRTDGNNAIHLAKNDGDNQMQAAYIAGGTPRTAQFTVSDLSWHHFCLTWSAAVAEWNAYLDAELAAGLPQSIGDWDGVLDANTNMIGAYSTAPLLAFSGLLSDVLVLNRPATAAEILRCI